MIRLRTSAIPVVVYFALTTATALQAQERMRAGMWETTISYSSGQTSTRSSCKKPAEVAMSNGSQAITIIRTTKPLGGQREHCEQMS